jgi:hypothetical protein
MFATHLVADSQNTSTDTRCTKTYMGFYTNAINTPHSSIRQTFIHFTTVYQLTSGRKVFLVNLTVALLVKQFLIFYATQWYITVFAFSAAHHWILS